MARLMNFDVTLFFLNFECTKEEVLKVSKLPLFKTDDSPVIFVEKEGIQQIIGEKKMREMECQVTSYIIEDKDLNNYSLNS